jgi:hypothetical protein
MVTHSQDDLSCHLIGADHVNYVGLSTHRSPHCGHPGPGHCGRTTCTCVGEILVPPTNGGLPLPTTFAPVCPIGRVRCGLIRRQRRHRGGLRLLENGLARRISAHNVDLCAHTALRLDREVLYYVRIRQFGLRDNCIWNARPLDAFSGI